MIELKNSHEKITATIQHMLIDTKYRLPYYGNFNLFINFHVNKNMPTAGVNMTTAGMNFYYNPAFIDRLSQKEVNFLTIHEDFHLLWDHPKRTLSGQYEPRMANIVQDMIINHVIWEDISHNFVEIPKDEKGRNMALFVPKEYDGKLIFEVLYEWLRDKRDEHDKKKKEEQSTCKSCGGSGQQENDKSEQGKDKSKQQGGQDGQGEQDGQDGQGEQDGQGGQDEGPGERPNCPDCQGSGKDSSTDSSGNPSYGPFGKDPKGNGSIDTYSLDQIFDNMDNNNGEYLDQHITDEIPEEMREGMIKDTLDKLQARGLCPGDIEETLGKLRKKKKDYLKYIKRCIANELFGTKKVKSITRPNRRGIVGVKGARKIKNRINIILDVSGSMSGGLVERVLEYVYKNDVEITLIEADTQVNFVKRLKNTKGLDRVPIMGMGGTVLQPAIDYVVENLNSYSTLILGDGYCDNLDCSGLKHNVLLISAGVEMPIYATNGKLRQIVVDSERS